MDNFDDYLNIYLGEVAHQAGIVEIALGLYNASINEKSGEAMSFFAVQAILAAGASVSKLLHPVKSDALHKRRGAMLRAALPVAAANDVLKSRDVRNAFEHFDENLDTFLATLGPQPIVDRYISDSPLTERIKTPLGGGARYLRGIRLDTQEVHILDKAVSLEALVVAIYDAEREASAALERFWARFDHRM